MSLLVSVIMCKIFLAKSELLLSGIITDNMILQIPYPSKNIGPTKLFGESLLNEKVVITGSNGFPGPFTLTPTKGSSSIYGNWSTDIVPNINDASFPGPYTIKFQTIDNQNNITSSITINNTYFGEIILCSGQSNMEYNLNQCDGGTNAKHNAINYPNVRLYQVKTNYSNFTLQNVSSQSGLGWIIPTSTNIGTFSCVCYETGILITEWLMNNTNSKPYIGLIESNIGGTSAYFWASGMVGLACNETGDLPNTGECATKGPPYYGYPGSIYNGMINPLCMNGKGISIRQVIWYQGEADSGENDAMTSNAYECILNGLIYSWRFCFNETDLSFIIIQLPSGGRAPYTNDDICSIHGNNGYNGINTGWTGIQNAQYNVYTMNNNTGLVTSMDQGQSTLHYPYKYIVSERAYLWSRYLTFNDTKMTQKHAYYGYDIDKNTNDDINEISAPIFDSVYKQKGSELKVYINVNNAGPNGLKLKNAVNCSTFQPINVATYNYTSYYCCENGGVNVIKFRLNGWYWYDHQGHKQVALWNWIPGNITGFINNGINNKSIIIAEPMLPQTGVLWPNGAGAAGFYYSEATTIKQIEIQTSPACSIVNSYGLPMSVGGPYNIYLAW